MKIVDKILLAATGLGIVFVGADYVKNRNKPDPLVPMYCPGCRDYIQANQDTFSVHYAMQHMHGGR